MTEQLTHTQNWADTWWHKCILYLLSHFPQEAGWGRQDTGWGKQDLGGRMAQPPFPPSLLEVLDPQCLQQLALSKWKTKLFTGKKKKKIPQVEGWGRGGDLVYPSLHCSFLWIFFTLQQAGDNMPPATAAAQPHQGFFDLRAPNTRTRNRFPWDRPRSRGHRWIKQQRREGWRLLKMRLQWRPHLRDRGDGFNRRTVS